MGEITQVINSRKTWIDISKGIAIILMVLGHTSIPSSISDFIWAFHMPLFFICSGICTRWNVDSRYFISKKTKSLLLPFAIYSFCVLIIKSFTIGCDIEGFLAKGWQGYALWFIPVLYFSLIIVFYVMRIQSIYLKILSFLIIALAGSLLSYLEIQLPWTLSSVPYAALLIAIGVFAKPIIKKVEKPNVWVLCVFFLITFVISRVWRLDMAWNNITPVLPLTIGACSGTLFVFTLSSFIEHYTRSISFALQTIGRETYLILAFSQIIILLINNYFHLNVLLKYFLLIIILFVLKYMKDEINKQLGHKLL